MSEMELPCHSSEVNERVARRANSGAVQGTGILILIAASWLWQSPHS